MHIGIVSDLHGNAAAWRAVSRALEGVDQIVCLGDMLGYGPCSLDCVQPAIDGSFSYWLSGNHEEGWWELRNLLQPTGDANGRQRLQQAWNQILAYWQSPDMRITAATQANMLAESIVGQRNRDDKDSILPLQYRIGLNGRYEAIASWMHFELELSGQDVGKKYHQMIDQAEHKSPLSLKQDGLSILMTHEAQGYLYPWADVGTIKRVARVLPSIETSVYLFGHSHIPMYATIDGEDEFGDPSRMVYGEWLPLGKQATLINPGSVGWPRDGDQRPAYAVLDTSRREVCFGRLDIGYDRTETTYALAGKGYPNNLIIEAAQGVVGVSSSDPARERAIAILQARKSLPGGVCP